MVLQHRRPLQLLIGSFYAKWHDEISRWEGGAVVNSHCLRYSATPWERNRKSIANLHGKEFVTAAELRCSLDGI